MHKGLAHPPRKSTYEIVELHLPPTSRPADTTPMTTRAHQVQVWIEDENGPLSGAEAAQVIRDIHLGNRDPEAFTVCVSGGIGTRIRGSWVKGRGSEFPNLLTDGTSCEPTYDHKPALASTDEEEK